MSSLHLEVEVMLMEMRLGLNDASSCLELISFLSFTAKVERGLVPYLIF